MNKTKGLERDASLRTTKDSLCTVFMKKRLFSPEECREILKMSQAYPDSAATIGRSNEAQETSRVRKSDVRFGFPNAENKWIFDRLETQVVELNNFYDFQLQGFFEGFQIARYEPGAHYTWHMDIGPGNLSARKLSMSVQLSDPSDYDGGDLQLIVMDEPATRQIGSLIVFPSYILHSVASVTRGARYSLVSWISGVPFR